MLVEIQMPELGVYAPTETLVKWLVSEGDTVQPGQVIAEFETEKVVFEYETHYGGIIRRLALDQGSVGVKVGTMIALLATEAS